MIGTSFEMLLYFTCYHEAAELFFVTPQRLRRLRNRIVDKNLDEDIVIDMLQRLHCVQVRKQIIIPSVIQDKNGTLYKENVFLRLYLTDELRERLSISDQEYVFITGESGYVKSDRKLKHILNITGASKVVDRIILPSVWSHEPHSMFGDIHIKMINKMLDA